jgi:poly-D-alanine transfer protein DltD
MSLTEMEWVMWNNSQKLSTKKLKYLKMPSINKLITMLKVSHLRGVDELFISSPLPHEQSDVNAMRIRNRQSHHP